VNNETDHELNLILKSHIDMKKNMEIYFNLVKAHLHLYERVMLYHDVHNMKQLQLRKKLNENEILPSEEHLAMKFEGK
jgi:hypothetical protein